MHHESGVGVLSGEAGSRAGSAALTSGNVLPGMAVRGRMKAHSVDSGHQLAAAGDALLRDENENKTIFVAGDLLVSYHASDDRLFDKQYPGACGNQEMSSVQEDRKRRPRPTGLENRGNEGVLLL